MISGQQAEFLFILAGALALFVHGRLRVDITALLVMLSLVIAGILAPAEALAGFSSDPAIIVASVFVLSAALSATGLTDRIGKWIGGAAGQSEARAILVVMPTVATLAAFSHHLMITAMMLPIIMGFARERKMAASRLLMPMSLAASLGTTLTLFSAPAFLLSSDLLQRQTGRALDVFSITPIGVVLVIVGVAYMLLMRWILPRRTGAASDQDYLRLDQYYTELVVEEGSPWGGRQIAAFRTRFKDRLQLVNRLRDGRPLQDDDLPLEARDVLLVRASPDEISSVVDEPGLALNALAKYGDAGTPLPVGGADGQLVQVVVGPNSEFIGRTIGDIDFFRTLGVLVVGLWRRDGWLDEEISEVKLQAGDLLVLLGNPERFVDLVEHRGFLMMVPFTSTRRLRHRAPMALGIMLMVVACAATGLFSTPIVFLAGAVAMIVARCVDVKRAYSEIDVSIFVMIAGVIPLGTAMEKTGTASLLAQQIVVLSAGWSALALLALMFAVAALVTQVLSDAATVVLLGPVAIALAAALGLPAEPFVICAALGAVASFLTPIGHHGNLLILRPGGYTFGDFLRIGLPLTLIIGAVSCWMAQAIWLDGPTWPSISWPPSFTSLR